MFNRHRETALEVKERILGFVTSAFAFVGALAWNEAIKAFIDSIYVADANSVVAKFIYALIVSVIVVVMSIYLTRFLKK